MLLFAIWACCQYAQIANIPSFLIFHSSFLICIKFSNADKSLPIEEKSCGEAACEKSKEEKKQRAKMRFAFVICCT